MHTTAQLDRNAWPLILDLLFSFHINLPPFLPDPTQAPSPGFLLPKVWQGGSENLRPWEYVRATAMSKKYPENMNPPGLAFPHPRLGHRSLSIRTGYHRTPTLLCTHITLSWDKLLLREHPKWSHPRGGE